MFATPHHAWTGGQYSLARAALGLTLAASFTAELGRFHPVPAASHPAVAVAGLVCAALLVLGIAGRSASASLLAILAQRALVGIEQPSPVYALPLALHLAVPPAPYLSWSARGRMDPAGGWTPPSRALGTYRWGAALAAALPLAWMLISQDRLTESGEGWALLGVTSAFGGGLLALSRRPGIGWLIVAYTLPLALVAGGAPQHALAAAIALAFAFDPTWVAPVTDAPVGAYDAPLLFYDGHCGLCHTSVRFCLAEDARGQLRYSALTSTALPQRLDAAARKGLPDSLVLVLPDGRYAVRSAAVVGLMLRLGGLWRVLGHGLWAVPRPLRNLAYRFIAATRHRLSGTPTDSCPILPPAYRGRFIG